MEKSGLAQEKVWFDKPAYDRAERIHFEKMAKVVSRKIMENCSRNISDCSRENGQSKKKCKSKERSEKSLTSECRLSENVKSSKTSAQKASKNEEESEQPKSNSEEKRKNTSKGKETSPTSKCNSKEMKEEKNKRDTRHRNRKAKHNAEKENRELKESLPLIKNTEQLGDQGNQQPASPILPTGGSLANEVAKARQHIIQSLQCVEDIAAVAGVCQAVDAKESLMELQIAQGMKEAIENLQQRVKLLEEKLFATIKPEACPNSVCPMVAVCPAKPPAAKQEDEDGDVDLFGSDSEGEDEEAAKVREERLAAYAAKKAKKPVLIAKSSIILDVKPWDDTTDMAVMEAEVRKIVMNGLLWGAAKLVPLAYGIKKLQISCVVEDDKVSVDELTEKIENIEDYVQSVDIAAFNKI